jgi:excisionase family DNA binding protein
MEKLVTASVVAEMLGVSRQKIYAMARLGTLPSIPCSDDGQRGAIRFRPSSIEKWLEQRERGTN